LRRPDADRPVKAVGYPLLPALYLVVIGLLCIDLLVKKPQYTWPGLVIVALGIPIFYLWRAVGRRDAAGASVS